MDHLFSSDSHCSKDNSGISVGMFHYDLPQLSSNQNPIWFQPCGSMVSSERSPIQFPEANLTQTAEWNLPLSSTPLPESFIHNSSQLTCSPHSFTSESNYQESSSQQDISLGTNCPPAKEDDSREQQLLREQLSFQFLEEIFTDHTPNSYLGNPSRELMASDVGYNHMAVFQNSFTEGFGERDSNERICRHNVSGCEADSLRHSQEPFYNQCYMQSGAVGCMPNSLTSNTLSKKDSNLGNPACIYPNISSVKSKPFHLCSSTNQSFQTLPETDHPTNNFLNATDYFGLEPSRQPISLSSSFPSSIMCGYDHENHQQPLSTHNHHQQQQPLVRTDCHFGTSTLSTLKRQVVNGECGLTDTSLILEEMAKGRNQKETDSNNHEQVSETSLICATSPQVPSGNTYFWQYNAQCKGPKALRLIDLGSQATLGRNLFCGKMEDLACSLEGTYFGPMESLVHQQQQQQPTASSSSCGDIFGPLDENDLKLPKLLANSTVLPYSLPDYPLVVFEDPVQRRYDLVHCSKLRRGDGNDVTPNLTRLRSMGEELECLNQQLLEHGEIIVAGTSGGGGSAVTPSPFTAMVMLPNPVGAAKLVGTGMTPNNLTPPAPTTLTVFSGCKLVEQAKREKNKLASKICRLKKKAFHEANKIKYTGLELEYNELATVIVHLKRLISDHLRRDGFTVVSGKGSFGAGHVQRINQDADSSEYLVSSTTGMEDGQRVSVYNNQCDTASVASRGNRQLDASCFDSAYSGLSGSHYSLFEQANYIHTTIHVTHAAGRTDALVEEVLRMSRDGLNTHPLVRRMALDGLGHISLADTSASHNRGIDDISVIASPDIPMSSNMRTTSIPGYLCDAGPECSQVSSVASKVSQTVSQSVIPCTQPPAGAFASQCVGVHPPPTFVVPYPYTGRPSINSDVIHY